MTKRINQISLLFVLFLFLGCAGFYHNINTKYINFPQSSNDEKVAISYRYDVLRTAGNKKMANKELKKNMKVVAVKITNNTESIINVEESFEFYSANNPIVLMSPLQIKEEIKQSSASYAFYFLGCITLAPLDIAVFGGIGLGNIIVASTANKNLFTELTENDIRTANIKPHESVVGLIGFRSSYLDPITIKLKNSSSTESIQKVNSIEKKQEIIKPVENSIKVEAQKVESTSSQNTLNVGDIVQFYNFSTNKNCLGTVLEVKSKSVLIEYTSFNQKKNIEKDIADVTKVK